MVYVRFDHTPKDFERVKDHPIKSTLMSFNFLITLQILKSISKLANMRWGEQRCMHQGDTVIYHKLLSHRLRECESPTTTTTTMTSTHQMIADDHIWV